jgi:GntR family transcriptional repressor for pyruvate dehydrogenase complex
MSLLISDDRAALDIEKVFEVRRLLEVEIAGKAAERRTEEDLMRMDEILKEAESNRSDREVFARLDVSFHQALADATHNPLFSLLLDSIADVMVHVRLTGFRVPGTPERGIIYHRGIYEQVQAENAEGARRAMVAHLIESEETQRLAMAYIQQNSEMKSKESERPG